VPQGRATGPPSPLASAQKTGTSGLVAILAPSTLSNPRGDRNIGDRMHKD